MIQISSLRKLRNFMTIDYLLPETSDDRLNDHCANVLTLTCYSKKSLIVIRSDFYLSIEIAQQIAMTWYIN